MKEKFVRDRRTVTPEEFRKTIAKIAEGRGEPCRAEKAFEDCKKMAIPINPMLPTEYSREKREELKAFEKRILESEEDIER